jgi:4-hydroxybenzoate polyprenyltransferase
MIDLGHVESPVFATWISQLRIHQWAKNLLIFVPLMASHRYTEPASLLEVTAAFIAFCFATSANYILNDVGDLQNDRRHIKKKERPLASGKLSSLHAIAVSGLLLLASTCFALIPNGTFPLYLAGYLFFAILYSALIKRVVILDVLLLAALYVLRIVAGGSVIDVQLSFWLYACSLFFFLSLALAKRHSELMSNTQAGVELQGRGYLICDIGLLVPFGAAAAIAASVFLTLYIQSPDAAALYRSVRWLWGLPIIALYWQMRLWLFANRTALDHDPVVFALRDPVTLLLVLLGAAIAVAARMA